MIISVKIDGITYEVSILNLDDLPVLAQIGNDTFEVWPQAENAQSPEPVETVEMQKTASPTPRLVSEPARETTVSGQPSIPALRSPLPGIITHISINPGDTVKSGQELMRLEAMKMSNVIRSIRNGTVDNIHVIIGQQVKHGDTLVSFK